MMLMMVKVLNLDPPVMMLKVLNLDPPVVMVIS